MSKLFWVNEEKEYTYSDLISYINSLDFGNEIIFEKSYYKIFVKILHSIINEYSVVLLDSDFSNTEIEECGIDTNKLVNKIRTEIKLRSFAELLKKIKNSSKWQITLLTSGTTGIPKRVTHSFQSLTKSVKTNKKHKNDVWGFAYNPTHMAGIQVFWQAFLNKNTMVNIFQKNPKIISKYIADHNITHISATPTFYRLFIKEKNDFPNVKQVSSGGEKLSNSFKKKLEKCFPNARIRNIYASTEAGSLFASQGEHFKIPDRFRNLIKIEKNEIIIHKKLMGKSKNLELKDGWYYTGDLVEIIKEKPEIVFKFVSRKNEMINVGGYKVNPYFVEEELLKIDKIEEARVYGKPNSLLGNILCADVVAEGINEKTIRQSLNLQSYKIPRVINFVNKIEMTRTGKVKR